MTPEDLKRIDVCLELYRQQMDHYHKTQGVEWRGTFGAWALGAAAVAIAVTERITLPVAGWMGQAVLCVAALAFPFFHALWLTHVHRSEVFDKKLWTYYRNEASRHLKLKRFFTRRTAGVKRWWLVAEVGPTLSLTLIFLWVLLGRS